MAATRRFITRTALLCAASFAACAAWADAPRFDAALAEATFQTVWDRVDGSAYDVRAQGVDWDAVGERYRPRALAAGSAGELRGILQAMLDEIGESHFTIMPASVNTVAEAAQAASAGPAPGAPRGPRYDTGLRARLVDGALRVVSVAEGSPAQRAGLAPGWVLQGIDGADLAGPVSELGNGPDGAAGRFGRVALEGYAMVLLESRSSDAAVDLDLRSPDGRARTLSLAPAPSGGEWVEAPMLPPMELRFHAGTEPLADGGCIAEVRFNVWVPAIGERLDQALPELRRCQAVLMDLRGNPGGIMGMMMTLGGHFVNETIRLGTLDTGEASLNFVAMPRRVTAAGERVQPIDGPMAILIDSLSMSTSEMFASGLQAAGRARVFGTASPGMALPAQTHRLPTGDSLMFAFARYEDPAGRRIEGEGVQPDHPVELDARALAAGGDPARAAALAWLRAQTVEQPIHDTPSQSHGVAR